MTYDFDDPRKFEDEYDASKEKNETFVLNRKGSKLSVISVESAVSNLSEINRPNLRYFGKAKIAYITMTSIVRMNLECISNHKYGVVGLIAFFFGVFVLAKKNPVAQMIMLLRLDVVYLTLIAGFLTIALASFGLWGALTHRKWVLCVFMILLWFVGILYGAVGFLSYKELHSFQFEANMNTLWGTIGTQQLLIQNQFKCCGYYSDVDRPFVNQQCAGFVTSGITQTAPLKRSLQRRQVYDPNPNIVPTIPGCHDAWIAFLTTYYKVMYYFAFAMIPFSLAVFTTTLLSANHLYTK